MFFKSLYNFVHGYQPYETHCSNRLSENSIHLFTGQEFCLWNQLDGEFDTNLVDAFDSRMDSETHPPLRLLHNLVLYVREF